ncbi:hypothetical protein ACFVUH_21115 [Kitasatospora sp. NPDC058032]|uniref:hypothetical protein n=1 Tax=Kitasatospora sp. NPDC058032 TaxID=3346307 RepID=UPI0036DA6BC6
MVALVVGAWTFIPSTLRRLAKGRRTARVVRGWEEETDDPSDRPFLSRPAADRPRGRSGTPGAPHL